MNIFVVNPFFIIMDYVKNVRLNDKITIKNSK